MKGWRTFTFNGALAVAGAVVTYLQAHGSEVIPSAYAGPAMMVIAMIGTWLRSVTTTPPTVSK